MSQTNPKAGSNKSIAHARKMQRCVDAAYREGARAERTAEDQLALLDTRPGESKKERAKLVVDLLLEKSVS